MDSQHTKLWRRIREFPLDDPDARLSFTARLARENGWSLEFARRVVLEYKRFLFLAMVTDHPVTPSDEVDQAWHLHLVYTRSYWGELCANVLRRPLHHGPTRGGHAEDNRYREQYEQTLASYRQWFNEDEPRDIWPLVERRFDSAERWARVCIKRNWIINKNRATNTATGLAIVGLAMALVGAWNPIVALTDVLLVTAGIGSILVSIWWWSNRRSNAGKKRRGSDSVGAHSSGCAAVGCGAGESSGGDGGAGCGASGCGGGGCGGG